MTFARNLRDCRRGHQALRSGRSRRTRGALRTRRRGLAHGHAVGRSGVRSLDLPDSLSPPRSSVGSARMDAVGTGRISGRMSRHRRVSPRGQALQRRHLGSIDHATAILSCFLRPQRGGRDPRPPAQTARVRRAPRSSVAGASAHQRRARGTRYGCRGSADGGVDRSATGAWCSRLSPPNHRREPWCGALLRTLGLPRAWPDPTGSGHPLAGRPSPSADDGAGIPASADSHP